MSTAENKGLCRQFAEKIWNKKDLSNLDKIITSDCPHYMNGIENFRGPDEFKTVVETWLRGFPNIQVTINDMVAEGDKVVLRSNLKGKHEGPLQFAPMPFEIPPTGKLLDIEMTSIIRIKDGKCTDFWETGDYSWIREFAKRK